MSLDIVIFYLDEALMWSEYRKSSKIANNYTSESVI